MTRSASRHGVPGDHLHFKHIVKASVSVIAALLSVSILVAFAYGWKKYSDLQSGVQTFQLNSLNQTPSAAGDKSVSAHTGGSAQNILIVGLDDRAGLTPEQIKEYHTGTDVTDSTDSIMVVHVPADGSKATLISIPRDTYVDIPDYRKNKINAAYADGKDIDCSGTPKQCQARGFDLLIKTVQNLTGLSINHFVAVGFGGFVNIANAIHGVEVNLCAAQNDPYSGLHVPAGKQRLSGAQALAFVRQRHNVNGGDSSDLTRAQRQRYFLAAAFKQVVSIGVLTSPGKLTGLINAIKSSFYVDDGLKLVDLAEQMADLTAGNIIGHSIPTGAGAMIDGKSVLPVDPAKVQAQIQTWLNPPPKPTSTPSSSSTGGASGPSTSASSSSSAALTTGCIH